MSARRWRNSMNGHMDRNIGLRSQRSESSKIHDASRPTSLYDPYADSDAPRWLKFLWRNLSPRHVFIFIFLIAYPFIVSPFFTFQVGAQSLVLGLIALSLTFLGGYGGIVSLAQMSIAGIAGY